MALIVPTTIDETVLAFCASISNNLPEMIPVRPVRGALENHCFGSVRQHVKGNGGKLVMGWAIWLHPGVFIDAEHHGVWEDDQGDLIDVTPKEDGEKEILFLRDDTATLKDEVSRNSIRKALINDLTVISMIKAADKFYPYFSMNSRRQYMDQKTRKAAEKALAAKNATIRAFRAKFPS